MQQLFSRTHAVNVLNISLRSTTFILGRLLLYFHHVCTLRARTYTNLHTQYSMLGAICGYGRSMDRAAQSMDSYFVQESMDHAR